MPSNHLILCHPFLLLPLIFPSIRIFSNKSSGSQSTGASASVVSMNIQGWFPWGSTGLISLQSKRLSRVFSRTTVRKHQFLSSKQLSLREQTLHAMHCANYFKQMISLNSHNTITTPFYRWAYGLRAAVHGVAKSWTRLSDWTELIDEKIEIYRGADNIQYHKANDKMMRPNLNPRKLKLSLPSLSPTIPLFTIPPHWSTHHSLCDALPFTSQCHCSWWGGGGCCLNCHWTHLWDTRWETGFTFQWSSF